MVLEATMLENKCPIYGKFSIENLEKRKHGDRTNFFYKNVDVKDYQSVGEPHSCLMRNDARDSSDINDTYCTNIAASRSG